MTTKTLKSDTGRASETRCRCCDRHIGLDELIVEVHQCPYQEPGFYCEACHIDPADKSEAGLVADYRDAYASYVADRQDAF